MRIAIFIKNTIYHGKFGGLETQNHNLVEGLKRAGHSVTVFAPALGKEVPNHIFIPGTMPGKYDLAWWERSLVEFTKQHRLNSFEVVISQSAAGANIIANKLTLDVKTVVIAHGTIWGELKTCWQRTKTVNDVPMLLKNIFFAAKTYFLLDKKYLSGCNHIVAVSAVVKDSLIREFGLAPEKITVIANGVDLARFKERPVSGGDKATFLYFGRLEAEKGLTILEEVFTKLHQELPNTSLLIVGNGPYQVRSADGVAVRLAVGYDDIPDLLAKADVFVLPTLRVEGLPMTLVESAAAGLPIIASDIGGNNEIVKSGVNGLLIKSGSVEELLAAMRQLATDLLLRQKMGLASRKIAIERFSLGNMVVKYLEILKKL